MNEFITLKEALEYLKVSRTTLWKYYKKGLIKPRRISQKLYFKKSELNSLIDKSVYVPENEK